MFTLSESKREGRIPRRWAHDLPAELWSSEVVLTLDPVDVLSLSQTCRTLRSILPCVSTWRRVLRSVCGTYGLFLPSYPIEEMGTEELQLASLGPQRWKRLVQRKAVPVQELDDAVPLPVLKKMSSDELWPHWIAINLVPGGRFLVMINGSPNHRRLELWDIGSPGKRPLPEPILLASAYGYLDSETCRIFVCPHEQSLRIATFQLIEDIDIRLYRVFSISPADDSPELVELAPPIRLDASVEVQQSFLVNRALFVQANQCCTLWNFEKSLLTRWTFEKAGALMSGERQPFLTPDYAVLLDDREALVWRISSLESRSQHAPEFQKDVTPPQDIPPDFTITFPRQTGDYVASNRLRIKATPVLGTHPSLTFDLFEMRLPLIHFHRYTLSEDLICAPHIKANGMVAPHCWAGTLLM